MNKINKSVLMWISFLIMSAFINTSNAQSSDKLMKSKASQIDALVSKYGEYNQFNGSILVAQHGKVLFSKGFGMANMEWSIENQTDTKFRLASVSKQFTAMLIVQLVAEGKLALHEPISKYLPDYPKKNGDQITLHHLLTHTSGIPNYTNFPNYREIMPKRMSPEALVANFADSALEFVPGEKFSYSNSGYTLLGYIIEKTSGKSYEEMLQEKIFVPLQMKNSGFDHPASILDNRASGYDKQGKSYVNSSFIDVSVAYSAGGIYSTVEDMYLWDQALYSEKLLPKKYLTEVFKEHISSWDGFYGYGWEISPIRIGSSEERLSVIMHGGAINGFNSNIIRVPSDSSFIIILANVTGEPLNHIAQGINGILQEKPYDFPKKSIADALLESIDTDGIILGLAFYDQIKNSDEYYYNEEEVNLAGYNLLTSGKAYEAAEVFKLNIQKFSGSFNAYDSYAEALMVMGKKKEAIANYRKSMELNPNNKNGIMMLKELGVDWDGK